MTRSTQELREAARRARSYADHERAELRILARAVDQVATARQRQEEAVLEARRAGLPWYSIARVLGISTNSAHQQFRHLERQTESA